jgi:hypothetical protein
MATTEPSAARTPKTLCRAAVCTRTAVRCGGGRAPLLQRRRQTASAIYLRRAVAMPQASQSAPQFRSCEVIEQN